MPIVKMSGAALVLLPSVGPIQAGLSRHGEIQLGGDLRGLGF